MNNPDRKAVVLLSGGIDSATTCLYLLREHWTVYPIFVDYGQRASLAEWEAAKSTALSLGIAPVTRVHFGDLGSFLPFPLLNGGTTEPSFQEYVPQRNLLLGTLAAMHTEAVGASAIAFGVWGDGHRQYSDTTSTFVSKLQDLLSYTSNIRVLAPFAGANKLDIVLYGLRYNLDYSRTWSCNLRSDIHCGTCDSCAERILYLNDFPEVGKTEYACGGKAK